MGMKRVGTAICIIAIIGITIALTWLIGEWIWSWNIPEWLKVVLISR